VYSKNIIVFRNIILVHYIYFMNVSIYHDRFCVFWQGKFFFTFHLWSEYSTHPRPGPTEDKSKNIQYNTLACWIAGTNDSSTKCLIFQALFFFIISYRLRALKTLYFYLYKIIKNKKINWNNFCKEFCNKLWKKIMLGTSDAW
jgi:hypothetical protein